MPLQHYVRVRHTHSLFSPGLLPEATTKASCSQHWLHENSSPCFGDVMPCSKTRLWLENDCNSCTVLSFMVEWYLTVRVCEWGCYSRSVCLCRRLMTCMYWPIRLEMSEPWKQPCKKNGQSSCRHCILCVGDIFYQQWNQVRLFVKYHTKQTIHFRTVFNHTDQYFFLHFWKQSHQNVGSNNPITI